MPRQNPPRQQTRQRSRPKKRHSATIDALRTLRASGDRSFEELVARLLSRISGERIRRCKAGTQDGVDALADVPFAIEDKRYAREVRSVNLAGGLTRAAGEHPDLQLWVLVATCEVGAQTCAALFDAGFRQGIGVLVLDATTAEADLPGVSTLAALAATDADLTLNVLRDPSWRTGPAAPDLRGVRRELASIQTSPAFGAWRARLHRDLSELPTWRRFVRSHNERLRSLIVGDAANAFGTPFVPTAAVPRSVEADLAGWWEASVTAVAPNIAVVTGDRYDGKTWLVYRWLSEMLPRLTVPVFLLPSAHVQAVQGDVETLVLRECERALGRFKRHAPDVLARHRSRRIDRGAWCIVVLDGANEYVAAPEARAAAMVWAAPPSVQSFTPSGEVLVTRQRERQENQDAETTRPCALLVTCRARDFEEDRSWIGGRTVQRIELGPYDDTEFRTALHHRGLVQEQLDGLPPSALEMVHRPRYLDLMLRHREDVPLFGAVTADVLHYLDASDKVAPDAATSLRRDPGAFKALLARLADSWSQSRRLTHATIWRDLQSVTERIEHSLHALTSEGVLTREPDGAFRPNMERLALGMGLFLRERLLAVHDNAELGQVLADLLEPHADDDEKARWLRAAVTVSLLAGDIANHPQIVQALLGAWITVRNFAQADLDDLRVLAPRLLLPVLELLTVADTRAASVFLATAWKSKAAPHSAQFAMCLSISSPRSRGGRPGRPGCLAADHRLDVRGDERVRAPMRRGGRRSGRAPDGLLRESAQGSGVQHQEPAKVPHGRRRAAVECEGA